MKEYEDINDCVMDDWKEMNEDIDCTNCIHYGHCYLRRHREDKEDVTPCKDIEVFNADMEEIKL